MNIYRTVVTSEMYTYCGVHFTVGAIFNFSFCHATATVVHGREKKVRHVENV